MTVYQLAERTGLLVDSAPVPCVGTKMNQPEGAKEEALSIPTLDAFFHGHKQPAQ